MDCIKSYFEVVREYGNPTIHDLDILENYMNKIILISGGYHSFSKSYYVESCSYALYNDDYLVIDDDCTKKLHSIEEKYETMLTNSIVSTSHHNNKRYDVLKTIVNSLGYITDEGFVNKKFYKSTIDTCVKASIKSIQDVNYQEGYNVLFRSYYEIYSRIVSNNIRHYNDKETYYYLNEYINMLTDSIVKHSSKHNLKGLCERFKVHFHKVYKTDKNRIEMRSNSHTDQNFITFYKHLVISIGEIYDDVEDFQFSYSDLSNNTMLLEILASSNHIFYKKYYKLLIDKIKSDNPDKSIANCLYDIRDSLTIKDTFYIRCGFSHGKSSSSNNVDLAFITMTLMTAHEFTREDVYNWFIRLGCFQNNSQYVYGNDRRISHFMEMFFVKFISKNQDKNFYCDLSFFELKSLYEFVEEYSTHKPKKSVGYRRSYEEMINMKDVIFSVLGKNIEEQATIESEKSYTNTIKSAFDV